MQHDIIQRILEKIREEMRLLREQFDIELIRNAAFSVGTEFYSAKVALQEPDSLPVAVPLLANINELDYHIENYQPFRLARALIKLKVPVLFVASDPDYLGGDPSHINLVKTGSDVAVIQRDFIIDEAQIYQAKSIGADGLLLDDAFLDASKMAQFTEITFAMGLEPFLKISNPQNLEKTELELISGIVAEKSGYEILRSSAIFRQLKEAHQGDLPILLIHFPRTAKERQDWEAQGISQFLLPDSWLLWENPVQELERLAYTLWPGKSVE
ncbi:MAG: hypothetical protein P8184_12320 [Calditrichia bacterium]